MINKAVATLLFLGMLLQGFAQKAAIPLATKNNALASHTDYTSPTSLLMSAAVPNTSAQSIKLNWEVGNMKSKEARPAKYWDAKVPGAVQDDYMRGNKLQHFSVGINVDEYQKLESDYWAYKTSFKRPTLTDDQNLVFYSKGIDYEFDILLNGKKLFYQEGMFTPVRLVLNEYLEDKNTLEIIIYPIPIAEGQPFGRRQAILAVKPPVNYSWDWHPRLVTVGIWDETGIRIEEKAEILETDFTYKLSEDLTEADINYSFQTTHEAKGFSYEWLLKDAEGKEVLKESGEILSVQQKIAARLSSPELWWPYDHGTPYRYTSILTLKNSQGRVLAQKVQHVGFRKVELVMNEGAWNEPKQFPRTQSTPPFTMRINNRIVFVKGSNWVHPEVFYGKITHERYLEQLLLVKELNMNMLRIWGGGITNKASFHHICDSLGIMVWQEFPLACNPYTNDPHFIEILEQEGRSIIKRVRQHPSLAMWSGGNELFNSWSKTTEQAHALRLLNSLCYRMDPNTPYIHTSPIYGVGHGHYLFYDWRPDYDNLDVFQLMDRSRKTAYTEFGMPSLAPLSTLEKIIPEEELFPPRNTPSWEQHGAFKAWKETSWAELGTIERYLGKAENLEQLVWQSQTLQSIGYKAIYEEGRRQKPYCSMVLNWCLNEPWETAANNSIIAYPNIKKPSFEAVKSSLRPVIASAKFDRFDYQAGTKLQFDVWMLNDTYEKVEAGHAEIFITIEGQKKKIGVWDFDAVGENKNLEGPRFRFSIPGDITTQLAKVNIEVSGKPAYNSEYLILLRSRNKEVVNVNRLD